MNRKLISGVAVAVVAVVAIGFQFRTAKRSIEIETATVQKKEIHPAILASGNFVYRQEVQLSSEVIGKVSEILVKEGDKIEKGQVLLRLDPVTYQAEVAQQESNQRSSLLAIERAEFNLRNQQRNLERSQKLLQAKFIGQSQYDEATHQVELATVELQASREALQQARAMRSLAQQRLAKTEVRAPINGTATAIQIKIGETAVASATSIAGSSLMTIADESSMMAEVNVDEADVARVIKGQSARVFAAAFPNQAVDAMVESISMTPKVSTQGRSYIVKLRLEDAKQLRTGMTCRVEIVVHSADSKSVLPIQAILTAESTDEKAAKNANYVFAVVNGVARKTKVEVGIADDTNQEVLKGVALGDTIIVGPARTLHELRDGDTVKVSKAAVPALALAEKARQ
jgi:HlyD family secretion protein